MKTLLCSFLAFTAAGSICVADNTPTVTPEAVDRHVTPEMTERAAAIVAQMTLEEKCTLIHGDTDDETSFRDGFHILPIERLGIPAVRMADGPQGVRNKTRSTYYPCGIALAASWNRSTTSGVGVGIGSDARARGVGIMLCPGVNIYRSPLCGRNFEYYGEDPYLASETAVQYIKGIQSLGIMSTIKHFALNNQEYARHDVSSNADERTVNEIYFPTFRKAVTEADVACVMTSYNPIGGTHAAENSWLIKDNLRKWGFKGIVMSDWSSTYSTLGCLTSGLDLEMPAGVRMNYEKILPLVANGVVDESVIDEKCIHILQRLISYGFLDKPVKDESIPEDYDLSRKNALDAALEAAVLLKNDGMLPLKPSRKTIVVLGPNADIVPFGSGSGMMNPIEGRNVSLYKGLCNAGKGYKVTLMDWKAPDMALIAKASAVIFAAGFGTDNEGEGYDRTYGLPDKQDEAILKLAEANRNIAVVVFSGGEVDIRPWRDKVNAVMMAWYLGQEGGNALSALLTGKESPSGRLPFTFWGSLEANPASVGYKPEKPVEEDKYSAVHYPYVEYSEGIFLGYRGMEHFDVKPLYPFGYGLTYSSFTYSDMKVSGGDDSFDVSVKITNTGSKTASEVVQFYVAPIASTVLKAPFELKAYDKVKLAPGKSATVTVHLAADAFSHYDSARHDWVVDAGRYRIIAAASALDHRLECEISL